MVRHERIGAGFDPAPFIIEVAQIVVQEADQPDLVAYLQRFHQVVIARSTVHRILVKNGMGRLPANQKHQPHRKRWKRYGKAQPGHRLQMDVKFLERIPGTAKRLYEFTAINDCTRIRILKIYDACNQRTAIRFLNDVRKRLPFRILVLQTDIGAEFQSQFHWHAESLDIRHVYIRPRSPHLNGKVECSHRIDEQDFYELLDRDGISDNIHLFNDRLREWENYYDYHGSHGALQGRTPCEQLIENLELTCHRGLETLHVAYLGEEGT